jgi:hypothetical protein
MACLIVTEPFRASPALLQYVTLQKYFSYPSLIIYFFPRAPIRFFFSFFSQFCDVAEVGDHP